MKHRGLPSDAEPKGRQVAASHPAAMSPPRVTRCPLPNPPTAPNSFQDVESLPFLKSGSQTPQRLLGGCWSWWLSLAPGCSSCSQAAPPSHRGLYGGSSFTPQPH